MSQVPPLPQGFDSDEAFLGYCEIHNETECALFSKPQLMHLLWLAGVTNPDYELSHMPAGACWSMRLCVADSIMAARRLKS